MSFNLIVAVDSNHGISRNGAIPWNIQPDMNFFQDVTTRKYVPDKQNIIIMGANTYRSFNRPGGLPGRINIVVSNSLVNTDGICVTGSVDSAIELCGVIDHGEVFVIGGMGVYNEFLERGLIGCVYLTVIDNDFECDNCFGDDVFDGMIGKFVNVQMDHAFDIRDTVSGCDLRVRFRKMGLVSMPARKVTQEDQYLNLLEDVLKTGHYRKTRNSFTYSVFGRHFEFDLGAGLPMITSKRIFLRGVFEETMFFLSGCTDIKILSDKGVHIWDANATKQFIQDNGLDLEENDMGPLYPFQFRHYGLEYRGKNASYSGGYDQIAYCLNLLMKDPFSRRILMSSYNPKQATQSILFPCHSIALQLYVDGDNRLCLYCYNRSCDLVLGIPWNVLYASLLIHLFCEVVNNNVEYKGPELKPGRLIMGLGDVHIYENHYEQVIRQILREPFSFPTLKFNRKVDNLNDFTFNDLELVNYVSYPPIKAEMVA